MLLSSGTKRNVQDIPHCVTFGQILLLERQNTLAEQQPKGETLVKSWQSILSDLLWLHAEKSSHRHT